MEQNKRLDSFYKILKPYFNLKFKDSRYSIEEYEGERWEGFYKYDDKERVLIVGHPMSLDMWFYNGRYLESAYNLLNIEPKEFNELLEKYVQETYGRDISPVS